MGNTTKPFKGQGHSLSGESQPPPPRKPSRPLDAVRRPQAARPSKKSEAELAEQRARQMAAAEARGKAWDNKLAKQRQQRAKAAAESHAASFAEDKGTAQGSADQTLSSVDTRKLDAKLDRDARELENSGVDVYRPNFSSGTQARSVIINGDAPAPAPAPGTTQPQGPAAAAAPGAAAVDEPRVGHSDDATPTDPAAAQRMLEGAMEACDVRKLRDALHAASEALGTPAAGDSLPETYAEALRLLELLQESAGSQEQGEGAAEAEATEHVQRATAAINAIGVEATLNAEGANATLRTLIKLLDNVHNNPGEAKFRKLRLENPTVHSRIVAFAQGAPQQLLEVAGFAPKQSGEEGRLLVLEGEGEAQFARAYSAIREALANLQMQL